MSPACFAFAVPLLSFMTFPTSLLTTLTLPLRIAATSSGDASITSAHHFLSEVSASSVFNNESSCANVEGMASLFFVMMCRKMFLPARPATLLA